MVQAVATHGVDLSLLATSIAPIRKWFSESLASSMKAPHHHVKAVKVTALAHINSDRKGQLTKYGWMTKLYKIRLDLC